MSSALRTPAVDFHREDLAGGKLPSGQVGPAADLQPDHVVCSTADVHYVIWSLPDNERSLRCHSFSGSVIALRPHGV